MSGTQVDPNIIADVQLVLLNVMTGLHEAWRELSDLTGVQVRQVEFNTQDGITTVDCTVADSSSGEDRS